MSTEVRNLGKYQLVESIARGGMGTVWKAVDTQLKRTVAIKLLHAGSESMPDFARRFEHEARLVASLHHPNIVKIHNFHISQPPESDPPVFYMVMDYVRGQTLADYIRQTSRQGLYPSPADILFILTAVSLALDYAHQQGMIHRDIKPANILLDQRTPTARPMGEPILTDFGIARQQGATIGTMVGMMVGTPLYMPPEQAQGQYDDYRSDLYSLGIILYEMLTGVTPFQGDSPLGIAMRQVYEVPVPPIEHNPQIPQALSDVVMRSIAKNPDERYPSASAFTVAVARALQMPIPARLQGSDYAGQEGATMIAPLNPVLPPTVAASSVSPGRPEVPAYLLPDHAGRNEASHGYMAGYDSAPPMVPAMPTTTRKRWRIVLTALITLVLCASSIGVYLLVGHTGGTASSGDGAVVGTVTFIKSSNSSGGKTVYNAVQITINTMPNPPDGMTYYAWVIPPAESSGDHWPLQVKQHTLHTAPLVADDGGNLLIPNALFLITQEQGGSTFLDVPDTDPSARIYYARLPANPATQISLRSCPTDPSSMTCVG